MPAIPESSRILYIQYTNPGAYPPLLHSSRILVANGWQVLFLGTKALGANALTLPYHPNIRFLQKSFCPPGWKQKIHYLWFSLWCVYWTFRWRPGWVYASDHWSCLPTLLTHWLTRAPFIYHEHDSPAPLNCTANTLFLGFVYWARRHCARAAAACVIPNENRAKVFQAETGASKIKTVWNCPTRDEVRPPREVPGPILRLLYHGSIVPERLPLAVILALGRVSRPICLKIVGYETTGSRGYLNHIRQIAAASGISERVEIAGAVPRQDLMELCATCDAGLALMPLRIADINLENMTGASNKPFDYLACGLAVLVSRLPKWRELFVDTGYGLDCDPSDPDSVAASLQEFCDHPEMVRAMGERGRQRILSEWNYETQFRPMLQCLSHEATGLLACPAQQ